MNARVKVGLVRHFRVKHDYPPKLLVTPDEVADWFLGYDAADIEYGHVDLSGGNWQHCFCSDLPRAIKTAEAIFKGDIVVLEDLVWAVLVRLVWYLKSHPNVETRRAVRERSRRVIDQVLRADGDSLIVSHAALMPFLRAELRRRGFRGPWFGQAANGLLYVFERT